MVLQYLPSPALRRRREILNQNNTRAPGVWAKNLINLISIYCHHWDCRLGKVQVRQAWGYLAGVWNVLAGAAYNRVLNCGSPPPRPEEEVFKVFEPKRVDSFLYTMIEFSNHGTQWGANCALCPTLSLDLRPEAKVQKQGIPLPLSGTASWREYVWKGRLVCWSLTSLCHSNGHIETMPAREINMERESQWVSISYQVGLSRFFKVTLPIWCHNHNNIKVTKLNSQIFR